MSSVRSGGKSNRSISSKKSNKRCFWKPTISSIMKRRQLLSKGNDVENDAKSEGVEKVSITPNNPTTKIMSPCRLPKQLRSSKSNLKPKLVKKSKEVVRKHENLQLASEVKKRDVKAVDKAILEDVRKEPFKELNINEKPEEVPSENQNNVQFNNVEAVSSATPLRCLTGKSSVAS